MTGYWKRSSVWIACVSASLLAIGLLIALAGNPVDATLSSATVSAEDVDASAKDAPNEDPADSRETGLSERVQVASLKSASDTLSQLVLAAGPEEVPPDAGNLLMEADALRETATPADAIRAYILVLDKYPDTPQAKAADERIAYLLGGRTEAEMDAIEAALPSPKELTDVDGITALGQFYFKRAQDAGEENPEQAGKYLQLIYDIGWDVFLDDLDDHYKATLLTGYLFAADALGRGEERRAALSAHANTLEPCFTSWIIKLAIDGEELPYDYVKSEKGRASIRRYYVENASAQPDPDAVASYYTKARDASWQMLVNQPREVPVFDHTRYYLESAGALGEEQRTAAIARIEEWIANEPLSIMRWVTRYELAMFLTREPRSSAEARAGFEHFEEMIDEADTGVVEAAINDTRLDENLRGLLVCMWGHAFAGTNRIEEAENCYNWVLTYFTNETHAGSSAAYSLALMEQRKQTGDFAIGMAALEEFVRDHPGSFYSAEALMQIADTQIRSEDTALAKETYERIEREYWDTSMGEKARKCADELSRELAGSE